jgi:hypothetical protein
MALRLQRGGYAKSFSLEFFSSLMNRWNAVEQSEERTKNPKPRAEEASDSEDD